jgi:hypothetical protein
VDEGQLFQGVDWRQLLPFTHIFRAFRIAIHPSKLMLGLALLLTVYAGGRLLDALWPAKSRAVVDEVSIYEASNTSADFQAGVSAVTGDERFGLFHTLFEYQTHEFDGVVHGVLSNDWFETPLSPGVPGHIYNFVVVGPLWLVQIHPVFAIFFAILFLSSWSLFGGAIARLAAVHVARDEKVSVRQALDFAIGKFLSFASAPIIPMLIVLGVGLLLAGASLLVNIPILGPVVLGAAFCLALLAGFVQTLVILGAIGGFNLMYPTVAVEGSDSFDAISRSFSYVYARPWRMLFYTGVAVAYGAVTYLFVRFFILLMLALAHHFVAMGSFVHVGLLPSMWPSPLTTGRLTYTPDYPSLTWAESIGAGMLSFWIYLVIGVLGAFAISFYFSANTIIYLLMRRQLDATAMDDVYLENSDDDFSPPTPATEQAVVSETVIIETSQASQPPAGAAAGASSGPQAPAGS